MSTYLLLDVGVARYMTTHGWASPPCSPQEPGSGCAGTGPWASTTEGLRPCVLLAVELDDQLFLDLRVDHLAGRQRVHKDLHLAGDRLQPRRNGPAARLGVGDHERRHLARLLADLDDVVLAHPAGRDVDLLAVDQEVAVLDQLAGHVPGLGVPGPVDHVVQPRLEDLQQYLTGLARLGHGLLVVPAALLLPQLQEVLGLLRATAAVLAGREGTRVERALRPVALAGLEEQLDLLAPATAAVGTCVTSHLYLPLRPGDASADGNRCAAAA